MSMLRTCHAISFGRVIHILLGFGGLSQSQILSFYKLVSSQKTITKQTTFTSQHRLTDTDQLVFNIPQENKNTTKHLCVTPDLS